MDKIGELEGPIRSTKEVLLDLQNKVEALALGDPEYLRLKQFGEKTINERRTRGGVILREAAEAQGLNTGQETPFDYKVLFSKEDRNTPEAFRVGYLERTKALVDHIINQQIDCVVFLDKSARPVYWLVDEFWDVFAGDKPKPKFKFVNIDKTEWNRVVGSNETFSDQSSLPITIDAKRAPEEIKKLHNVFSPEDSPDGRSYFSGSKVLLVDEVRVSGDTLEIARQFFTAAFPDAKISTEYWMRPAIIIGKDGVQRNEEVPAWYRRDKVSGGG